MDDNNAGLLGDLTRLRREQEIDEMRAVAWIKDATGAEILQVWMAIQKLGGPPLAELISRFAQLGMTHAILLTDREKT